MKQLEIEFPETKVSAIVKKSAETKSFFYMLTHKPLWADYTTWVAACNKATHDGTKDKPFVVAIACYRKIEKDARS